MCMHVCVVHLVGELVQLDLCENVMCGECNLASDFNRTEREHVSFARVLQCGVMLWCCGVVVWCSKHTYT